MQSKLKKSIILCVLLGVLIALISLLYSNGIFSLPVVYASTGTDFVIEKNPIERVEVVSDNGTQLKNGETVKLSCYIYPEIANETSVNVSYEIIRGADYAYLVGDELTINDYAPVGSIVEVIANVDDVVSSNSMIFTIVATPVESIEIIALKDTIYQGAVMHLGVNIYPNDATNKEVLYSIVEGKEYAEINFIGTVAVVKNLPAGDLSITVRVTSVSAPNVYSESTFTLYKPVIGISSANTDLKFVEQKRSYSFMANAEPYNATFGNNPVTYSLNVDENIATISEDGLLYITDTAPIGQSITVHMEATDEIYYEQTVTVVPVYASGFAVKDYTAPNEGNCYLPKSVIDFDVEFFGADNISECNKKYFIEISDDALAYLAGNTVIIRSIEDINIFNPSLSITLSTIQDGILMSEVIEIGIYIPVTNIVITQKSEWVNEATTYFLDELFLTEIYPTNSSVRLATYEIVSDNNIVYLDGNKLKVINDVPFGNMKVQLRVKAYDQKADILFNVYKPTKSLAVFVSNLEPISSKKYGEKVILTSTTDDTASFNNPTFRILKGANNIQGDYKDGEQLFETKFDLKSNLAYQANFYPIIIIEAEQDGVIAQVEINVYIPNENIVLSTPSGLLNRGALTYFSVSNTPHASEYGFEITSVTSSSVEKIDLRSQTIKLYSNVSAGTQITINYRAIDRLATNFSRTFVVGELINNNTQFNVLYSDSVKNYSDGNLYAVIEADGAGVAISRSYKHLKTGESSEILINFGGKTLSSFGLALQKVVSASDNISITKIGTETFTIKVSETASGRYNTTIKFTIYLKDGNKTYTYTLSPLEVFRPITGVPSLLGNETIVIARTQLSLGYGSLDSEATYGLADFAFSCSENGRGLYLSSNGYLTINADCEVETLSIKISCNQKYNNTTILKSATFNRNVRWMMLKDTLRNTETKILGVGDYTYNISVPSCGQYIFGGYYTSTGGYGTCYYNESGIRQRAHTDYYGNTTLYAKWSYAFKEYCDGNFHKEEVYVWDRSYTWEITEGHDHFKYWTLNDVQCGTEYTYTVHNPTLNGEGYAVLCSVFDHDNCVVAGTLITLADGTQKAVEDLVGTEHVLAWDFRTGKYVSTPIMFIVNHGEDVYEVINLYFSDGTKVGIISEHGFFDYDLNKFVFIRYDAENYIGHFFNKQYVDENGCLAYKKVQLVKVEINEETTVSFSPVTSKYLNYYVNGMLSASAETDAFVNVFDFDSENMVYASTVEEDIELYGLFTYDDFKDYVPEIIFDGFNAKYLKIAIGKGLTTMDEVLELIHQYSEYLTN